MNKKQILETIKNTLNNLLSVETETKENASKTMQLSLKAFLKTKDSQTTKNTFAVFNSSIHGRYYKDALSICNKADENERILKQVIFLLGTIKD